MSPNGCSAPLMAITRETQEGSPYPRTWVMMGHKAGDNSQILALAEGLGWPFEIKHLVYRPTELLTNLLAPLTLLGIVRDKSSRPRPPLAGSDHFRRSAQRAAVPVDPGACRQARPPRARRAPLGADRELRPGGHHAAVPPAQAAERAAQYRALATGRRSAPAPGREHLGAAPCPPAAAVYRRHDRRQRRAVCPRPGGRGAAGTRGERLRQGSGRFAAGQHQRAYAQGGDPGARGGARLSGRGLPMDPRRRGKPVSGLPGARRLDHRDLREHVDADRGVRHLEARLHVRPAHRSRELLGIAREPDRQGRTPPGGDASGACACSRWSFASRLWSARRA